MKDYLLELALRKADVIRSRINVEKLEKLEEIARSFWRPYEPVEVEPGSYSAVDGSQNQVSFKGFTLYAVIGYGLARRGDSIDEAPVGDIDVLMPPGVPERIQLYRETAEAIASYLVSRTDLVMIDGSIKALLIHPRPLAETYELQQAVRKLEDRLGEGFYREYWRMINKGLGELERGGLIIDPYQSKKIMLREGLVGEEDKPLTALLEYLEKLMILRRVIEENRCERPRLLYISKTSRTMEYVREAVEREKKEKEGKWGKGEEPILLSDIVLFSAFTREPGYSEPKIIPLREVKRLPIEGELGRIIRGFYDNYSIALTFIRLVEGGPVFKLEIPVEGTGEGLGGLVEKHLPRILNLLRGLEVNGYPYPLIEVDKTAKITRKDMHTIAMSIGLLPQVTGREVLEEWF